MNSIYADPILYDLMFSPEPFLPFYRALAEKASGPVCELACGTGQLILPISELGHPCVGVDLDPGMLKRARERAQSSNAAVEFIHGDMRDLALDKTFSLIFVARNSLLHLHTLADLRRFFGVVKKHLAKNGVFAFDVFNPNVSILAQPPNERKKMMELTDPRHGTVLVESSSAYRDDSQIVKSNWFFSSETKSDFVVATLALRCIFPQELSLLLGSLGFGVESLHGDFEGTPFQALSARQVCVCRAV